MAVFSPNSPSLLRSGCRAMIAPHPTREPTPVAPVLAGGQNESQEALVDTCSAGDAMVAIPVCGDCDMGIKYGPARTRAGFSEDALGGCSLCVHRIARGFENVAAPRHVRWRTRRSCPSFATVVVSGLLVFLYRKFDMLFDRLRRKARCPRI